MAVTLPMLQQIFQAFDGNRDGRMDRQEIAQSSLSLFQQGNQFMGGFMASFLQGGLDRQGLMPDYNRDGALDLNELNSLSNASGYGGVIETSDFATVFQGRVNPQGGGSPIDINQLQATASGQGLYGGSLNQGAVQLMQMMLQMMMTMLGLINGGGLNQPQATPVYGQPVVPPQPGYGGTPGFY